MSTRQPLRPLPFATGKPPIMAEADTLHSALTRVQHKLAKLDDAQAWAETKLQQSRQQRGARRAWQATDGTAARR